MIWPRSLSKLAAIFSIYFQEALAYRASGVIWILTDVTTAITMPLVWISASKGGAIAGYSTSDTVLYYLCTLMIGSFVTSHIMWEIAMEIKEGQFSTALVRPISFFQVTFMRNLTWRIMRSGLFLPFFLLFVFLYRSYLTDVNVALSWQFWSALVLGHLVSYTTVVMMAMLALFVQEAMAIFELYYLPMLFLSGQMFPVAFLPDWAIKIAKLLPFYYTTALPTEILVGRVNGSQAIPLIGAQLGWVIGATVITRWMWKAGLKQYTAVGM